MILGIVLPIAVMVALAILLPRLLARWMPESVPGLILNGGICVLLLALLSGLYFFAAYTLNNTRLLDLIGLAPGATLLYFLRLGLASALIWGPILVLALAAVPKRWKEAVW